MFLRKTKKYNRQSFEKNPLKRTIFTSRQERKRILKEAYYNLFFVPSRKVTVDFLTDSGTGELSKKQWSILRRADEAYAGSRSWERFEISVKKFTDFPFVLPAHQGRGAETTIVEFLRDEKLKRGDIVLSNGLFDTTRANFEKAGVTGIDMPTPKALDISSNKFFKGDVDSQKAEKFLRSKNGKRVKIILLTLTNNTGGGQPASLSNIRKVATLAKRHRKLFIIDACRIAENAYFIWRDERGMRNFSISKIIQTLLGYADIAYMSAKKDGLSNSGGFIVTNNEKFFKAMYEPLILHYGFPHYGGMSGRDMETVAQGLKEVASLTYLRSRIEEIAYLHSGLKNIGIPVLCPSGGHAVYVDAARLLPHIPKERFPGKALECALYLEGGIRSCEIGSVMFGGNARHEWVRLAIPRRKYTKSAFDHVIASFKKILDKKDTLRGFTISEQPETLRHFTAYFEPIA